MKEQRNCLPLSPFEPKGNIRAGDDVPFGSQSLKHVKQYTATPITFTFSFSFWPARKLGACHVPRG